MRVESIVDTPPSLVLDKRVVRGRSGVVLANSQFESKMITVNGRLKVDSLYDFELLKEDLKGLLVDSKPFYITKMLPTDEGLYHYELPGESTDDLDFSAKQHEAWPYRWYVTVADDLTFSFRGRTINYLLYDFEFVFVTAGLPYGETKERNLIIGQGEIPYKGNANISQLEWPFAIELRAGVTQTNVDLTINGRRFLYEHSATIKANDVLLIKGFETTLNGMNVNNRTSYEHFELVHGKNTYQTTFNGLITILNYKEFYK
ncbi:phage tail domain-containing protein [Aerococcaceae bacterium WGS1372]